MTACFVCDAFVCLFDLLTWNAQLVCCVLCTASCVHGAWCIWCISFIDSACSATCTANFYSLDSVDANGSKQVDSLNDESHIANDPIWRDWNEHTELNRLILYVFQLGFRNRFALPSMDCYFSSQSICDLLVFCIIFFSLLYDTRSDSIRMMFWVFWLSHISCCSLHGFYLYQQMHAILLQIKWFAFESVILKVYRPFFFFVCLFANFVVTFNLNLALHFEAKT